MAESIAEADAHAAQAAEEQAGKANTGASPALVQVRRAPIGHAMPIWQAAPNLKITEESIGQMHVENGPLAMRLEDVHSLKTRRLRVLQQLDSRLKDWGWTPALRELVERFYTLFCRIGLFEIQVISQSAFKFGTLLT
ncbi:hypothetical protein B5M09_006471 [Aphanomyces astaci]|uniref:Uncharacterized protein n=1 Tax=Aphanomyces astaci TaxID=112090 RepID=A0A425DBE2_APHAT|nr:hypothetical protein B5M09_006471 [Aphanomyces astaci]